jgi:protein quaking
MCTYGAIAMPNTEMVRVTALVGNSALLDQDGLEHGSPLSAGTFIHNGSSGDLNGWGDRVAIPHAGWNGPPGTAAGTIVKKTQRIEVPVDKYPNVCSSLNASLLVYICVWY